MHAFFCGRIADASVRAAFADFSAVFIRSDDFSKAVAVKIDSVFKQSERAQRISFRSRASDFKHGRRPRLSFFRFQRKRLCRCLFQSFAHECFDFFICLKRLFLIRNGIKIDGKRSHFVFDGQVTLIASFFGIVDQTVFLAQFGNEFFAVFVHLGNKAFDLSRFLRCTGNQQFIFIVQLKSLLF